MKKLNYEVVNQYWLQTKNSYLNGSSPYSGDDDREGMIIRVETKDGVKYVDYEEAYFHYDCTRNPTETNEIQLNDEEYIEIPSQTIDYHYKIYNSYEECVKNIKSIEENGYYVVVGL